MLTSRRDAAALTGVPGLACGLALPAVARAGPLGRIGVALVAAAAAAWLGSGMRPALVVVAAAAGLIVGIAWSEARLRDLARDPLRPAVGHELAGRATVTAELSTGPFGSVMAASLDGRRIALRVHERVHVGEIVRVSGRLAEPSGPRDGFDEREWLARQGMHEVLRVSRLQRLGSRGGLWGVVDRAREGSRRALLAAGGGEQAAVVEGILLGGQGGLSEATRADFRRAGLAHLLAVSGGNVALLVALVLAASWLAGLSRAAAHGLAIPVIGAYALVVGPGASVVRAAVAGIAASLAWLAGRPGDRWHALALGAVGVEALDPYGVLEPGFQLSFTAVLAIFVLAPRLRGWLDGVPCPGRLRGPLAISLACTCATAPVTWWHFGQVSLAGSIPANALALPAVAPLTWLAAAAVALQPVLPAATLALDWAALALGGYVLRVAALGAAVDGAVDGALPLLALAVLVGGALWLRRRAALASALAAAVLAGWLVPLGGPRRAAPTALRVTFLDVGQGSAALVEAPGLAALVDAGPAAADVAGQLRRLGVRHLDVLVLSHPQADHVGGAAAVLRSVQVARVLDPRIPSDESDERAALAAAAERGVPVMLARAGVAFTAGAVSLRVIGPRAVAAAGSDPNRSAVVLEVGQGACRFLLTADAESDVTLPLDPRPAGVLEVAHHGSVDAQLPALLRVVRPRLAVISVGAANRYGHPTPATLAALADAGVPVRRTDRDGPVTVACPASGRADPGR